MKMRGQKPRHHRGVLRSLGVLALAFSLGPASAFATKNVWCKTTTKRVRDDVPQKMAGTLYNVPKKGESNFRAKVALNGTGVLPNGKKVTYANSKPQPNVDSKGNNCSMIPGGSVAGAAGLCMLPFYTVAADPRFYSMGDLICINDLKGVEVRFDGGTTVLHTGCLIVGDTGGAIKGENRFDFFTGTSSQDDPKNVFGTAGTFRLTEKKSCDRQFTIVRQGSSEWSAQMANIEQEIYGAKTGRLLSYYSSGGVQ